MAEKRRLSFTAETPQTPKKRRTLSQPATPVKPFLRRCCAIKAGLVQEREPCNLFAHMPRRSSRSAVNAVVWAMQEVRIEDLEQVDEMDVDVDGQEVEMKN